MVAGDNQSPIFPKPIIPSFHVRGKKTSLEKSSLIQLVVQIPIRQIMGGNLKRLFERRQEMDSAYKKEDGRKGRAVKDDESLTAREKIATNCPVSRSRHLMRHVKYFTLPQ